MSWTRVLTARAGEASELDTVLRQWSNDTTELRDRTLELIRFGHMLTAPPVVLGVMLMMPGLGINIAGTLYLLGMVFVLLRVRRQDQAGVLAFFDLLLMGFAGSGDPTVWTVLLVPVMSVMTMGWLISHRVSWMLWASSAVLTGAGALVSQPDNGLVIWLVFAGTAANFNATNLKILGAGRDSVLRVADLIESLPVIVWESDVTSGEMTRAVGRIGDLLGFAPEDWRRMPLDQRVHPDDVDRYRFDRQPADVAHGPLVREVRLRRVDGDYLGVREVVRLVEAAGHHYMRGVILDIADETAAREAVDRLAAVVDHQAEPLVVVEPRGSVDDVPRVLHVNPAFAELGVFDADLAVGRALDEVAPWLPPNVVADLGAFPGSGEPGVRDDLEVDSPTGARVFAYQSVDLPDGSMAIQFTDVTDRKKATELIRHQAFHDHLTALPNRMLLFDRLGQAVAMADREGSTVGLLLLDLNEFKEINDTLGHAYGDELLSTLGTRLRSLMRQVDTVARLGGDEFAIVVSGADEADLLTIAMKVSAAIKEPLELRGIEVEIAASVGGAIAPLHGTDPHLLLQRADVAMYDAKRAGVPYRLYTRDDDRHSLDRLMLMGELRKLVDDELRVWFQPKVDLRTGRAVELEALARWQHRRLGLLGPGSFIELCEVSGLIADLTFRVLDESLATIADWPGQRVAVNVPVRNLYDRALPDLVAAALDRHGIEPNRLILEITEREIMEDHRTVVEVLEELHSRGVRISIDDFGTGFSSLTHLRRLPIHEIKIDRSFVSGMLDRENDYIIARSIIDLAHNLGHRVVAEGVEDAATLELLRTLGCDVAQGYLFARPGPAPRIRARIEDGPAFLDEGLPTTTD